WCSWASTAPSRPPPERIPDTARPRAPGSGTPGRSCARSAGTAPSSADRGGGSRPRGLPRAARRSGESSQVLDVDACDHDIVERLVAPVGRNGLDRVDDALRGVVGDLAEDRVLAVEPGRRHRRDEELRAVGAAAHLDAGVGHGEQVGLIEHELGVDLAVELVAGPADALTERVATLQHEFLDDAVEDDAVVERLRRYLTGARVLPLL